MIGYDEEKTQQATDAFLRNIERYYRLAGKTFSQHLTASYSFELKSVTNKINQPIEDFVSAKVDAIESVSKIEEAMNSISQEERQVLYNHYYKKQLDEDSILDEFKMSRSTYYRKLKYARLSFAESYDSGQLLKS